MIDIFILYGMCAIIPVSLTLAPLGCFLVWRQQSFFGDAMAHSAMLGVAISLLSQVTPLYGILGICVCLSALLAYGPRFFKLPSDAWLSLLSYTLMAMAFIVMRMLPQTGARSSGQVEHYLFGDLLLLTGHDVIVLCAMAVICGMFMYRFKRSLILITLDPDWAHVEGIRVPHMNFLFLLMLSSAIATTLPIIGALLVPGLILLPGAVAAQRARSPERMMFYAIMVSMMMLLLGMGLGFWLNWPIPSASIVSGFILFLGARIWRTRLDRRI